MRVPLAVLIALACLAVAVSVATAQGGGTLEPRGSSVGDGTGGAPSIAARVRRAARAGRCKVRSFASTGLQHSLDPQTYAQIPPTSGTHAPRWADWGIYDAPVPHPYQLHNLEHGGVVFHVGARTPGSAGTRLGSFFAAEPGYLVIAPAAATELIPPERGVSTFPQSGFVITSWQRRLICRSAGRKPMRAAFAFIRRYRGAGPEQVPAFNATTDPPADLPTPAVPAPQPR